MTSHIEEKALAPTKDNSTTAVDAVMRFSTILSDRVNTLATGPERDHILEIFRKAVSDAQMALTLVEPASKGIFLPMSRLKVSELIEQGLVSLSQASLYRAVENKRFYCLTANGRSIGKEFPEWQFIEPVPELLPDILRMFDKLPNSETHAFFVSSSDELNDLSPAEVLSGRQFESRTFLHPSQMALLNSSSLDRKRKVLQLAEWTTKSRIEMPS